MSDETKSNVMEWRNVPDGRFCFRAMPKWEEAKFLRWTRGASCCGYWWSTMTNGWEQARIPEASLMELNGGQYLTTEQEHGLRAIGINETATVDGIFLVPVPDDKHTISGEDLARLICEGRRCEDSVRGKMGMEPIHGRITCHDGPDAFEGHPVGGESDGSGVKHDAGKPRLELLPPSYWSGTESARVADWWFGGDDLPRTIGYDPVPVLTFGAEKYGEANWFKGMKWSRLVGAFHRHCNELVDGRWLPRNLDDLDEESGLPHGAHAECCLVFLREYVAAGIGENDSPWGTDGKD